MDQFALSENQKKTLLEIAHHAIEEYFNKKEDAILNLKKLDEDLKLNLGAFVSIYYETKLRGCIGRFQSKQPLYELIAELTLSAALTDDRFEPIQKEEVKNIDIEISILTPLKKIDSIDEIELGKHGIYIKDGFQSGTFLPQVANKTGWTKEEFLGHCSRDKARIGWNGWKVAELFTYEAIIFSDKNIQ